MTDIFQGIEEQVIGQLAMEWRDEPGSLWHLLHGKTTPLHKWPGNEYGVPMDITWTELWEAFARSRKQNEHSATE